MTYKAKNFASSTLAVGLGSAVGDTTLQIQVGDVSKFSIINDGGVGTDYTMLVLTDSARNREVLRVSRHDSGSASFTVLRGQEGTTARVWQAGDSISERLTAGVVTQTYTHPEQATGAHAATAISFAPAGNLGSINVQTAIEELDLEKAAEGHTHAATSITFTPAGNIAASTVQAAIQELDSEKQDYDADTAKLDVVQTWTAAQTFSDGTLKLAGSASGASTLKAPAAASTYTHTLPAATTEIAGLAVAETFTAPQRGALTTDNDGSFDLNASNNFKCTPTAPFTLTFTNHASGQAGNVILVNTGGHAVTAAATTKIATATLTAISTAGTYLLGYVDDGTNAYVAASGELV